MKHVYLLALAVLMAPVPLFAQTLLGHWTFDDLSDATGNFPDLQLNGATLSNGSLDVGSYEWASTSDYVYSGPAIGEKTLVSWAKIQSFGSIQGGSILTIDRFSIDRFDGIVFAEFVTDRWMVGSNDAHRFSDLGVAGNESSTDLLQMAISYRVIDPGTTEITVCRNGVQLGQYLTGSLPTYPSDDVEVHFGIRHTGPPYGIPGNPFVNALIEEARIYSGALSCAEVGALILPPPDSDGDGVPDHLDPSPLGIGGSSDGDGDGIIDAMAASSEMLTTVLNTIVDGVDAEAVETAIKSLDKAMDPALWRDASSLELDSQHGTKAFDGTKQAVKKLGSVSTGDATPTIETVTNAVHEMMKETSTNSIDAAQATCDGLTNPKEQIRCQKEVDQAIAVMTKATVEEAQGTLDKAIDLYKKAWGHTETANRKTVAKVAVAEAVSPVALTLSAGLSEGPAAFELQGNYPNPFNPQTTISFGVPATSHVTLTVFDLTGRTVATLVDGVLEAGSHTTTFDASHLPSGFYVYTLSAQGKHLSGHMLLLK